MLVNKSLLCGNHPDCPFCVVLFLIFFFAYCKLSLYMFSTNGTVFKLTLNRQYFRSFSEKCSNVPATVYANLQASLLTVIIITTVCALIKNDLCTKTLTHKLCKFL